MSEQNMVQVILKLDREHLDQLRRDEADMPSREEMVWRLVMNAETSVERAERSKFEEEYHRKWEEKQRIANRVERKAENLSRKARKLARVAGTLQLDGQKRDSAGRFSSNSSEANVNDAS